MLDSSGRSNEGCLRFHILENAEVEIVVDILTFFGGEGFCFSHTRDNVLGDGQHRDY